MKHQDNEYKKKKDAKCDKRKKKWKWWYILENKNNERKIFTYTKHALVRLKKIKRGRDIKKLQKQNGSWNISKKKQFHKLDFKIMCRW